MQRRFAVVLLAAVALAAVFILPARAASRGTHRALRSSVRALHAPKATVNQHANVNVAWTPAATMPTALEETGGGAGAGNSFYVIGGHTVVSPDTAPKPDQLQPNHTETVR